MIRMIQRLLEFSGSQKKNLMLSFLYSLIDSIFAVMPIMAILTVLGGILSQKMRDSTVWISLLIMLISIAGRIIFGNLSSVKRTLGSFDMCAEKRIEIGEKLKSAPMGYFDQNRLGDITAAITTTLNDIETSAVTVFDKVANGFIHAIVINTWLFFYEWHIGLITFAGILVAMGVYLVMQKVARKLSPKRQAAQAELVTAFLEFVQGMAVVKAFGLDEQSAKAVNLAVENSAQANIRLEKSFSSLTGVYQTVFKMAASLILAVAPLLFLQGEIELEKCLLLIVSGFMIYSQIELVGSVASITRVVDASLDRMEMVLRIPKLDEQGEGIIAKDHNIELREVCFSYGSQEVLRNISLWIPEKTSCAIVGPSGSGKTTLCHLIARFWDVDSGEILLGGHNVKEYTSDSLMKNFSIVFQNVYLFEDTIENNIRFGNPEAGEEEVVEAAKKACCHEFIMELPQGYKTKVGEGGSSLSGGEKQRISIARSLLKDAPIVILDEATASVDPENEQQLQQAIRELTKNKTVILIAHRLSTIRKADQIVVLDGGRIVQQGRHETLMQEEGIYRRFVKLKEKAIGWRLT